MPSKLICLGFIFSFIFLFCPINCENSKNQKLGEYIVSITFLDEIMSGRCKHNMELNYEYSGRRFTHNIQELYIQNPKNTPLIKKPHKRHPKNGSSQNVQN